MQNPYAVLGVKPDATEAEIRARYRQLVKLHHPDLHPGKPEAEALFKDISVAYGLLSDAEKRARFDRGEIDAAGIEKPPERQFYRDFADDRARAKYRPEDIFGDDELRAIFGGAFGRRGNANFSARGGDTHYVLSVGFLDAANGAVRRLTLPDGGALDVKIPPGVEDRQVLRLAGKGGPGHGDGPPGDALIELAIEPHPLFRRQGNDVIAETPIDLKEAVLGAKIQVQTVTGPVSVTIPPHSTTGSRLRLKGRGIKGGHHFVELRVVTPTQREPVLEEFLRTWTPEHPADLRRDMASS